MGGGARTGKRMESRPGFALGGHGRRGGRPCLRAFSKKVSRTPVSIDTPAGKPAGAGLRFHVFAGMGGNFFYKKCIFGTSIDVGGTECLQYAVLFHCRFTEGRPMSCCYPFRPAAAGRIFLGYSLSRSHQVCASRVCATTHIWMDASAESKFTKTKVEDVLANFRLSYDGGN